MRIVSKKVSKHVNHEDRGEDEIVDRRDYRIPVCLRVGLVWRYRAGIDVY